MTDTDLQAAKDAVGEYMLTKQEVCGLLSMSITSLDRGVKAGTLPAPIHLTPGAPRWRASQVRAHIEKLSGASA